MLGFVVCAFLLLFEELFDPIKPFVFCMLQLNQLKNWPVCAPGPARSATAQGARKVFCHHAGLAANERKLRYTLETHVHAEHLASAGPLVEHASVQTVVLHACGTTTAALPLQGGAVLQFGGASILASHPLGPAAGSLSD